MLAALRCSENGGGPRLPRDRRSALVRAEWREARAREQRAEHEEPGERRMRKARGHRPTFAASAAFAEEMVIARGAVRAGSEKENLAKPVRIGNNRGCQRQRTFFP